MPLPRLEERSNTRPQPHVPKIIDRTGTIGQKHEPLFRTKDLIFGMTKNVDQHIWGPTWDVSGVAVVSNTWQCYCEMESLETRFPRLRTDIDYHEMEVAGAPTAFLFCIDVNWWVCSFLPDIYALLLPAVEHPVASLEFLLFPHPHNTLPLVRFWWHPFPQIGIFLEVILYQLFLDLFSLIPL